MNAAREAFFLVHLGSRYRDQRSITEGLVRHLDVIKHPRKDVEKPEALTDDAVLEAAYTLGATEVCSSNCVRTLLRVKA